MKTASEARTAPLSRIACRRRPRRELVGEREGREERRGENARPAPARPGGPRDRRGPPQQDDGQDPDARPVRGPQPDEAGEAEEAVQPADDRVGEDPGERQGGAGHGASRPAEPRPRRRHREGEEGEDAREAEIDRAELAAVEGAVQVHLPGRPPGHDAGLAERQQQLDRLERVSLQVAVRAQESVGRSALPRGLDEQVGVVGQHRAEQHGEESERRQGGPRSAPHESLHEEREAQELGEERREVDVVEAGHHGDRRRGPEPTRSRPDPVLLEGPGDDAGRRAGSASRS